MNMSESSCHIGVTDKTDNKLIFICDSSNCTIGFWELLTRLKKMYLFTFAQQLTSDGEEDVNILSLILVSIYSQMTLLKPFLIQTQAEIKLKQWTKTSPTRMLSPYRTSTSALTRPKLAKNLKNIILKTHKPKKKSSELDLTFLLCPCCPLHNLISCCSIFTM